MRVFLHQFRLTAYWFAPISSTVLFGLNLINHPTVSKSLSQAILVAIAQMCMPKYPISKELSAVVYQAAISRKHKEQYGRQLENAVRLENTYPLQHYVDAQIVSMREKKNEFVAEQNVSVQWTDLQQKNEEGGVWYKIRQFFGGGSTKDAEPVAEKTSSPGWINIYV